MDGLIDDWMYRPTDGWTNGWTMFHSDTDAIDASENDDFATDFAIFTKALRTNRWTNRQTNGPTDRQTNGPTDQRTDISSYRDAIAASKKTEYKIIDGLLIYQING